MSYLDDQWRDPSQPRQSGLRREWPTIASAVAAVLVCMLSGTYLAQRWHSAAPYRAQQEQRPLDREVEWDRQQAEFDAASSPDAPVAENALAALSDDQRERLIAQVMASGMDRAEAEAIVERMQAGQAVDGPSPQAIAETRTTPAAEPLLPAQWIVRPDLTVRAGDLPPDVREASVRISCNVALDGRMTGCRIRETPAGSGLAQAAQRAIDRTPPRLQPLRTVSGRTVTGTYEFGWTYTQPPPRPVPVLPPHPSPTERPSGTASETDGQGSARRSDPSGTPSESGSRPSDLRDGPPILTPPPGEMPPTPGAAP